MTATTQERTIVHFNNGSVTGHWLPSLIRAAFRGRHAPAHVARATGSSERAADYYIAGQRDMAATKLLKLMVASPDFEQQVLAKVRAEREATGAVTQDRRSAGNRVDEAACRAVGRVVAGGRPLATDAAAGEAAGRRTGATLDGGRAARAGRAADAVGRGRGR